MSGHLQGGTGVGVYPLGVRSVIARDTKTPGSRENFIRGIRARRRVSFGKGVIRTPLPPYAIALAGIACCP